MGERFDMSRPIYAQIVERLKAKILAGIYPPGGHLDSVRDMAAAAGVNPNTMQRALAQLEAEGLVYTERTTGRFVTEDTALLEQLRDETARAMTAEYLEKMRGIGYGPAETGLLPAGRRMAARLDAGGAAGGDVPGFLRRLRPRQGE